MLLFFAVAYFTACSGEIDSSNTEKYWERNQKGALVVLIILTILNITVWVV